MSETVPFVVGQWVRGARFYGRARELDLLLHGEARCTWVAGLRRIGKTSLLRQLELLAGEGGRLPLFWDLQGVDTPEELALGFTDALVDAGEALARHGIALADVESGELITAIERLLRALAARDLALLLLCDEADELVRLAELAPQVVAELGGALIRSAAATVVLACSPRGAMRAAAAGSAGALGTTLGATLGVPLHLGVLGDEEARQLVRQSQIASEFRPPFDEGTVEILREQCGNHPMLLQLAGRRCLEIGDVDEAVRQVAGDRTLEHLFAVDLGLLTDKEGALLRAAACARGAGVDRAHAEEATSRRLLELGLLRVEASGRLVVPNRFLAAWLLASRAA